MGTVASKQVVGWVWQNGIYSRSAYGSVWEVWVYKCGRATGTIVHA